MVALEKPLRREAVEGDLDALTGKSEATLDFFHCSQSNYVARIYQQSDSAFDAGEDHFGISRPEKAKPNEACHLRKHFSGLSTGMAADQESNERLIQARDQSPIVT